MHPRRVRATLHTVVPSSFITLGLLLGPLAVRSSVAAPPAALRPALTHTGAAAGDHAARVSGAGDLNGDGYDDWAVGAPFHDANGSNSGRVYVYFGGPAADQIPDLTLDGFVGDQFGSSVAAGDFNGDGYDDLIVGGVGINGTGGGRAYLGGPAMDSIVDLHLIGEQLGDNCGASVSGAGDVNRDGYDDVLISAPGKDNNGTDRGRIYVYHGGGDIFLNDSSDLFIDGAAAGDNFGISVSWAGDMNGDGHDDMIIGAMFEDTGGTDAGRAYVYYGGNPTNTTADLILTGESVGARFGESVRGAGDVNGDGYADVIVGATQQATSASSAGRAYVFFGGSAPDNVADLVMDATASDDNFGRSVSGAGDVNADGYADLIVGAHLGDAAGLDAGRAYVYYGGPGADGIADHTLTGAAAGDHYGYVVSGAGDVYGDGFDDVIVGSRLNDAGGADAGRAHVYDLNRYFVTTPNGGETWNVGSLKTISWHGAEPADLWLSVDGGNSYQLQRSSVGGDALNAAQIRVPHTPTKFAMIRITPADGDVSGEDRSDSLFTIQTSVSLLALLAAPLPEGGASISWRSDPGPEDLAGYKVEASALGTGAWRTVAALTRETSLVDPEGGPGTQYRLSAVNGFGEELWLGETAIQPRAALSAWPLPYRGGALNVAFAAAGGLGNGGARTEVAIYDLHGRLVKRLAQGTYAQGHHASAWDGRDTQGREVSSGVYFLRSVSGGDRMTLRLCVLR